MNLFENITLTLDTQSAQGIREFGIEFFMILIDELDERRHVDWKLFFQTKDESGKCFENSAQSIDENLRNILRYTSKTKLSDNYSKR